MAAKGIIMVVAGPSGVGKSTLVKDLLEIPGVVMSVSCTTREPRPTEQDGRDYFFLSREQFEERAERGEFAEFAEVFGNLYGTPWDSVDGRTSEGLDVVMDIDVQGAAQLMQAYPDGTFVFVLPPSREELERRLRERRTESDDRIEARLKIAEQEVARAGEYSYAVVNDDLEDAKGLLRSILKAERSRARRVLEGYKW